MRYLTVCLLLIAQHTFGQPYTHLVLEGGGIRGIAYAGALKVLEEKQQLQHIERIAGTSVGSIVAALVAVGYTADELNNILDDLKLQKFNDGKMFFLGGAKRMKQRFGWYRGDELEKWMGKLIATKTGNANLTFAELHALSLANNKYKDLYAVATNLTMQRMEVLSHENFPAMPIKTAVRASTSIPLYFGAVFIDSTGTLHKKQNSQKQYEVLVDGGVIANYPLTLFDTGYANMQTLGLKLERPEQIEMYNSAPILAPYHIDNMKMYFAALYNVILENLNRATSFEHERSRTIYISTGNVNPRIRRISKMQKEELYNNGQRAALKFFQERNASANK